MRHSSGGKGVHGTQCKQCRGGGQAWVYSGAAGRDVPVQCLEMWPGSPVAYPDAAYGSSLCWCGLQGICPPAAQKLHSPALFNITGTIMLPVRGYEADRALLSKCWSWNLKLEGAALIYRIDFFSPCVSPKQSQSRGLSHQSFACAVVHYSSSSSERQIFPGVCATFLQDKHTSIRRPLLTQHNLIKSCMPSLLLQQGQPACVDIA